MRNDYYVYVILDQRKPGSWLFENIIFNYKPFYVGIGIDYRMTAHFTPFNLSKKSIKNNIIKSICSEINELPIYYKIYQGLKIEEAHFIEIDFIKKFGKIKNNTGILSNLTDGGDGTSGYNHTENYKETLRKKVYQYDINGIYLKEWNSLKEVIDFYQISGGSGIRKSMEKGIHCKGFLWSYIKVEKLKPHLKKRHKYRYYIYKDNILIKEFNNKEEIELFFNKKVSDGNISSCCSNKINKYLGYKWEKSKFIYN
jgi:hypothetical protein